MKQESKAVKSLNDAIGQIDLGSVGSLDVLRREAM